MDCYDSYFKKNFFLHAPLHAGIGQRSTGNIDYCRASID
jgi:hypothetical protein